ncbi:hypothetical protein [Salicibibacter kimchii]|uniref:Uncharacterized protein n=1 Tax=Salicibibacter kimchii TaxID=2099786 RepID=A0A345C1M2_9BACI|nr:hypothetical protein [Salicibibacter kimchii]AXF57103.1 hypothetical protein DT065_14585 [Salicibibacter kimchii]
MNIRLSALVLIVVVMAGRGEASFEEEAPHTTTHERYAEVRDAEIYTGSIALLIQEYTDAHIIYNVYEGVKIITTLLAGNIKR